MAKKKAVAKSAPQTEEFDIKVKAVTELAKSRYSSLFFYDTIKDGKDYIMTKAYLDDKADPEKMVEALKFAYELGAYEFGQPDAYGEPLEFEVTMAENEAARQLFPDIETSWEPPKPRTKEGRRKVRKAKIESKKYIAEQEKILDEKGVGWAADEFRERQEILKRDYIFVNGRRLKYDIREEKAGDMGGYMLHGALDIVAEKGTPRSTTSNLAKIILNSPYFGGRILYDTFRRSVVYVGRKIWSGKSEEWQDNDTTEFKIWLEKYDMKFTELEIERTVNAMAHRRTYSSLADQFRGAYVTADDWDGAPRIATMFADCLGAEDNEVNAIIAEKTILGAIARATCDDINGVKVDEMTILSGEQGAGKSTFWRLLCPRPEWFVDSKINIGSKDGLSILGGSFILELAELASMTKATSEDIKSFLSSQADKYRPAYGRHEVRFVRHNIFVGSVNDDGSGFLKDPTGSRRFKVVPIEKGKELGVAHLYKTMTPDYIRQIWAEGLTLAAAGHTCHYNAAEEAITAKVAEKFQKTNPLEPLVVAAATMPRPENWEILGNDGKRRIVENFIAGRSAEELELVDPPQKRITAREVCSILNLSHQETDRLVVHVGRWINKSPLLKPKKWQAAGQQIRGFVFIDEETRLNQVPESLRTTKKRKKSNVVNLK